MVDTGRPRVPLEKLWGSFWVDPRQVDSCYKHRDLEVQETKNWVISARLSQLQPIYNPTNLGAL